ncbi:4-alpha-glucanotransferase [Propionibacterium australiense]|uniref:4-alpha-glucanotransferase n=1 Tax=Propionibacterium australiense TaxID=119981 RepID=A0A383SA08_9ACTN|nr:4-alpha-glucanotransferase [Propionibacterium australiense]RLP06994.1 4-alpha-glucanotransferase [Propionibacterium australiense]SYZ34244.1 4-alpha-glucanotransferase [Propionibacterium australiense]VEH89914.1 4-alpha-glucanotransferase [Propionibacterium australiense]
MALSDPALNRLAELFGIATQFWDWKGRRVDVTDETVVKVLAALGVDASTPEAADEAVLAQLDKPWRRVLPPVVVMRAGNASAINVHVEDGHPAQVQLRLEDGRFLPLQQIDNWEPARLIDGRMVGEASFALPADLPLGYHRIQLVSDDLQAETTLIVSPDFLGFPRSMADHRIWGYAVQLYSVRSADSWGTGDFYDLGALAGWSASQQYAGYVLINPVHAAEPVEPLEPSPYLPTSRLFVNPMYIRPEAITEYAFLDETDRARVQAAKAELAGRLAGSGRIERDICWSLKRRALRIIWAAGRDDHRQMMFEAYRRREGRMLRDYATWAALTQELGRDWRLWPPQYQRPTSPEVDAFRAGHADEIDFQCWLQWIASVQAGRAQQTALDAGMPVGVVTDLAVGVSAAGADTWMMSDVYAEGMTVGAPPDAYNQLGQDWGQPPWRPDRLEDLAYAPFRTMVRNALRHAGGMRMDHIIGMFRLWWVPAGCGPREGTYVRYDHEALIGIIALEAYRAQAMVIGEDLGTVEPWVRDYLAGRGILGTSVLWFEEKNGHPRAMESWREYAMASVNTHDLPPTAGYLDKSHVRLRHGLGLLTESLVEEERLADEEQERWMAYLRAVEALDESMEDTTEAKVLGLYRMLTRTPSRVLCATLVDAVGEKRIQNQPGTIDEYPNWRVPLGGPDEAPLLLEDIYAMERPMRLAAVLDGFTQVPAPWERSGEVESRPVDQRPRRRAAPGHHGQRRAPSA